MPQTEIQVYREADGSVPLVTWLEKVEKSQPKAYAKCLDNILELSRQGHELRRPTADMLEDGIYELRSRLKKVHYRVLYFFHGSNVAILSHGFTKEDKVPDKEIELAKKRRKLIQSDGKTHIAEWVTDEEEN